MDVQPLRWEKTYCPYCGVGCGLQLGIQDGRPIKVKGDPLHPANFGEICAKAAHLIPTIRTGDRMHYPQMRLHRAGSLQRTSWGRAFDYISRRFEEIIDKHGPDAVAFYGSGQLLTEDYYVFNKLAKGFLGTNNFDTNSRLCMASAVAAYTVALGADGPPLAYNDIELADLFFLVGSNAAWCHPIIYRRVEKRKRQDRDNVKVIVVDPRRTETAELADMHLAIRPGSDLALMNAMLAVLIREQLIDEEFVARHTTGWNELRVSAIEWTPERAAAICGIEPVSIVEAALLFGRSRRPISMWSMGVNQSTVGTRKSLAIINLHLATGTIGRPGCGPFSLTGQPNAMGGREVGGLSHLLPGYRRVENLRDRVDVTRGWRLGPQQLSARPGLSALELFDGLVDGRVKAAWVICSNPAASMPDLEVTAEALRRAELLVVEDSFHPTDTSIYADVLLPAAQWPEKEGVMTNSERRITYLPKLLDAPGEALPDWQIAALFGRTMGFEDDFAFADAEAVFEEYKHLTAGTLVDVSGISYRRLREEGPIQWPCPAEDHPGTARLYLDRHFATPNGRANFMVTQHQEPAETTSAEFPLILTTGRVRNQWHTMTRTGKAPALLKHTPEPYLEVHPENAADAGVHDGEFVEVRSRRGVFIAQARVTRTMRRGTCFAPFHWGRTKGEFKAANNMTNRAIDPISKQPELKFAAVAIKPASLSFEVLQ
jgi:ferredoxin-nitrate reductase